jgi:hypothetical protein
VGDEGKPAKEGYSLQAKPTLLAKLSLEICKSGMLPKKSGLLQREIAVYGKNLN